MIMDFPIFSVAIVRTTSSDHMPIRNVRPLYTKHMTFEEKKLHQPMTSHDDSITLSNNSKLN